MDLAVEKLTGNTRECGKQWSDNGLISSKSEKMTHLLDARSTDERYFCVDRKRFENISAMKYDLFGTDKTVTQILKRRLNVREAHNRSCCGKRRHCNKETEV